MDSPTTLPHPSDQVGLDSTTLSQVLDELRRRTQEQTILNAIASILNHPLKIAQSLGQVCEQITSIIGMESVGIYVLDPSKQYLTLFAHHGLSPQLLAQVRQVGVNDPAIAPLIYEGRALALDDVTTFSVPTSLVGPRTEGYHAGIGVPILRRGVPAGAIYVGSKVKKRYNQADVALLQNIANQIGVALENADLYAQMRRRMFELEGLAQLSAICVAQHDPQTIATQVVEWTKKLLDVNLCVLRVIEDGELRLWAGRADSPVAFQERVELDVMRRQVIEARESFVMPDIEHADLPIAHRQELQRLGLRAFLVVPLSMQTRVIGLLAVGHNQPRAWSPNEIELLQTIANQAGIVLENARLYAQMQQRLHQVTALMEISAALVSNLDPQAIATVAVEWIERLFAADVVNISLFKEGKLYPLARRTIRHDILPPEPIDLGDLATRWAESRDPFAVNDVTQETAVPVRVRAMMESRGMRALLVVPLLARDQVIGTLAVLHTQSRQWTLQEQNLLQTIGHHVANALDKAHLYQNALTEKRKVQAIFDSGLSGLFVTDAQGRIVMFNRAAERITGWTLAEVEGKDWRELFSDRAAGNPAPSLLEQALYHKKTLYAFEGRKLRTRDGRIIPVAKASAPLLDENDNVIGAVGAFWDLTRELRAEIEYENFLAMITHQIRSPLTAILSALELFERHNLSDERRRELWTLIKTEGNHLKRLADQFLTHQKLTQSDQKVRLEKISIAPLVRQTVQKFHLRYPAYHFHIDIVPPEPLACADSEYLTNILQNLLDNAVVYSPPASRINVEVRPFDAEWLVISVQDFGMGIPLSEQQYVFQPFYRIPQTSERRVYGHGLGLTIVREMVEAMGGKIWVESDVGQGATFYFTVRRAQ